MIIIMDGLKHVTAIIYDIMNLVYKDSCFKPKSYNIKSVNLNSYLVTLTGNYTSNQTWDCLVRYLKIISTWKNYVITLKQIV